MNRSTCFGQQLDSVARKSGQSRNFDTHLIPGIYNPAITGLNPPTVDYLWPAKSNQKLKCKYFLPVRCETIIEHLSAEHVQYAFIYSAGLALITSHYLHGKTHKKYMQIKTQIKSMLFIKINEWPAQILDSI